MPTKAKADARVALTPTAVTQNGLTARQLATQYATDIGPRIDPALVTGLAADLTSIGALVPAVKGAKDSAVQATAEQASALDVAYNMVSAVRASVSRDRPAKNVGLAYGVGGQISRVLVKDVVNALQKIINRATAKPTEALKYGITAGDVQTFTDQVATVEAADQAQEQSRAQRPLSTKQRNTTLRRIIYATDRIGGAGMIVFANDATKRAAFAALIHKE